MKMNFKKILITGLFVCLTATVFADEPKCKNAIGMYFMGADDSFGGIQYERRFTNIISEKAGIYASYENSTGTCDISVTGETDFTLYETSWKEFVNSRLFAYALIGYHGYINSEYHYVEGGESYRENTGYLQDGMLGLGFGFDFTFFGHLSLPIEFGFVGNFPNNPHVGFCAGAGIRYCW